MKTAVERRVFLKLALGSLILATIPLSTGCSSLRPPQASDPPPPDVGPMPNGQHEGLLDCLLKAGLEALAHPW